MVKVRSVVWDNEAWEIQFEIHEGVYHLDNYPVRITHLGHSEREGFTAALETVATGLLRMHMRRGAVPPHAVVINWARVVRLSHGGPDEVQKAIAFIQGSPAETLQTAVSNEF